LNVIKDLHWLITLGNVFVYVGTCVYWIFCISYTILAKWWRHESGAHLFTFSFAMALILTYVTWRTIFPINVVKPLDLWARAAIFGAETVLATWRLSILGRSQYRAYRIAKEEMEREVKYDRRADDRTSTGGLSPEEQR
jgi:hypothetical protein